MRSNNPKVSEAYARQTNYINKDVPWRQGNFFMIPYGTAGDELVAARKAIKTACRIIGRKPDGTYTDVETDTMSELSCVPALISSTEPFTTTD